LRHIIIDTDPGVDDALALLLALSSPELQVEGITTVVGNVGQEKANKNALRILEFLGLENIPVSRGAERPLIEEPRPAEYIHGPEGLGCARLPEPRLKPDDRSAVELILEKAGEFDGRLTLIAVGPLTNIAAAILAEPGLPEMVDALIIMGGAYGVTPYGFGNVSPAAEFNIWHDPEAGKIIFKAGFRLTAIGLDVTTDPRNRMSPQLFQEIEGLNTDRGRLVADLSRDLVGRFNGLSLHDPLAVAAAIDPTLIETRGMHVDVETRGELTRGMTVTDRRPWSRVEANVEVAVDVDSERFLRLFMDRVVYGEA
jgi:inosine-uridine nucleoside N-ribohydrolase